MMNPMYLLDQGNLNPSLLYLQQQAAPPAQNLGLPAQRAMTPTENYDNYMNGGQPGSQPTGGPNPIPGFDWKALFRAGLAEAPNVINSLNPHNSPMAQIGSPVAANGSGVVPGRDNSAALFQMIEALRNGRMQGLLGR